VLDADPSVKDLLSERLAGLRNEHDQLAAELATSIGLWFDTVPRGKGAVHPLANGIAYLRPDPILNVVNRGDRRCTFLNDLTGRGLLHAAIAFERPFTAEDIEAFRGEQAS
jgi:hypothetical protein